MSFYNKWVYNKVSLRSSNKILIQDHVHQNLSSLNKNPKKHNKYTTKSFCSRRTLKPSGSYKISRKMPGGFEFEKRWLGEGGRGEGWHREGVSFNKGCRISHWLGSRTDPQGMEEGGIHRGRGREGGVVHEGEEGSGRVGRTKWERKACEWSAGIKSRKSLHRALSVSPRTLGPPARSTPRLLEY